MKLKKFKEIYEREGFDDIDQPFEDDLEQGLKYLQEVESSQGN